MIDPHLNILHLLSLLPGEDEGFITSLFFIFSLCSQEKMKGPHLIILHLLSLLPGEDEGILITLFIRVGIHPLAEHHQEVGKETPDKDFYQQINNSRIVNKCPCKDLYSVSSIFKTNIFTVCQVPASSSTAFSQLSSVCRKIFLIINYDV
jgi:hypothetical protein